jgi:hypothetical protein
MSSEYMRKLIESIERAQNINEDGTNLSVDNMKKMDADAKEFIKDFRQILKSKGVQKLPMGKQSAQFDIEVDDYNFYLSGWHGTGAYGPYAMIHGLTSTESGYKDLFTIAPMTTDDAHIDMSNRNMIASDEIATAHYQLCQDILNYIKNL